MGERKVDVESFMVPDKDQEKKTQEDKKYWGCWLGEYGSNIWGDMVIFKMVYLPNQVSFCYLQILEKKEVKLASKSLDGSEATFMSK